MTLVSIGFLKGVLLGPHFFETPPGAERDAAHGLIRDEARQPRRVARYVIDVAERRAAARQHDETLWTCGLLTK